MGARRRVTALEGIVYVVCADNGAAAWPRGRKRQQLVLVGSRASVVVGAGLIFVVTLLAALSNASEHLLLEPPQPDAEDNHSDCKGRHQAPE
jgi:hypothetical protein